jgi:hypothetical protein
VGLFVEVAMPKVKDTQQIDFTDLIPQNKSDFEEGFTWMLTHHITNGHIALMGHNGKGWSVYCFFRGLYSKQRQWVEMPTFKRVGELTGIHQQTVKKVALELEDAGFIRFRRSETKTSTKPKLVSFQVIDSIFFKSKETEGGIESISTVFEPELLKPTMDGYKHLKRTGDHSKIPNSFHEKSPRINLHINITNNIIKQGDNSQAIIQDITASPNAYVGTSTEELQKYLETNEVKDLLGMTLNEAIQKQRAEAKSRDDDVDE